jgi:FkbM family methyltransferase
MNIQVKPVGSFRIRLRRNRSFWLRHPLLHEGYSFGSLHRLVRPGDVVYDVGANIGLHVRFVVGCLHARQVVAFEPAYDNVQLLKKNVELGQMADRVRVLPIALADVDGEQEFQLDDVSSASGVLNSVSVGKASESRKQYGFPPLTTTVQVATLDSLVERERLPAPDVIKVDIEGAEGLMLRGARKTLERFSPKLAIELHGLSQAREVLSLLSEVGYTSFGFIASQGKFEYRALSADDVEALTDRYDLDRLVASKHADDIREPIQSYAVQY